MKFRYRNYAFFGLLAVMFAQTCCLPMHYAASHYNKRKAYDSVAMLEFSFKIVDPNTKEVEEPGVYGTGFAIDDRYIATAGHVCVFAFKMSIESILNGMEIQSTTRTIHKIGKKESIEKVNDFHIVAVDVDHDLCIIESPNHGLTPVKLAKDYKPHIRDSIFAVGAPRGIFPVETDGYISLPAVIFSTQDTNDKMLCSISIYKGNSGSPIFNANGEVVGVIVSRR